MANNTLSKMTPEALKPELLKLLACPKDQGELSLSKDKKSLKCRKCGKSYEIKEGVPVFV